MVVHAAVPAAMPDMMLGMSRSMVTMMQFSEQKQDYTASLANLQEGTEQYRQALEACHRRGAERCARVAKMHRGLYVKAAQFLTSLRGGTGDRGIPRAYTEALAVFTDHAPYVPAAEIAPVLREAMDLGGWPEGPLTGALRAIEELPVASASLAQVHRAELQDGRRVAVKVQYPALRQELASDFAVFRQMGVQISSMAGGYDFMWVVDDFEKNLQREVDFLLEADSSEATCRQLSHLRPHVHVPHVLREYSSERVLTMEYVEGLLHANDPRGLAAAGLDVEHCAELLCSTFAEMIFVHGRVHADPHAGNIYFRVLPESVGRPQPQLVILDHGLYYDLSENEVRRFFCSYWQACCRKDRRVMTTIGERFAGKLHRFLPLLLSPWFVFGGSGVSLKEIISASKGQLPDSIGIRDVADFVQATRHGGANLIGLLHALGYTRGLLEALGYSEEKRLNCMLKYAVIGDSARPVPRSLSTFEQWTTWWHLRLLQAYIYGLAPFAWLLIRYARMEQLPRVGCTAVGCSSLLVGAGALYFGATLSRELADL